MTPADLFYAIAVLSIFVSTKMILMLTKKRRTSEAKQAPIELSPEQTIATMQNPSIFNEHKVVLTLQLICFVWAIFGLIFSDMRLLFFAWLFASNIMPLLFPLTGRSVGAKDMIAANIFSILSCLFILYKHFFIG